MKSKMTERRWRLGKASDICRTLMG